MRRSDEPVSLQLYIPHSENNLSSDLKKVLGLESVHTNSQTSPCNRSRIPSVTHFLRHHPNLKPNLRCDNLNYLEPSHQLKHLWKNLLSRLHKLCVIRNIRH